MNDSRRRAGFAALGRMGVVRSVSRANRWRRCIRPVVFGGAVALVLGGCSSGMPKLGDLNPFKEKEEILAGKRVSVLDKSDDLGGNLEVASAPVSLPTAAANADWSQPGGTPDNAPGHLLFDGSAKRVWTADAGTGSSSTGRLTSGPIVYQGKVFTLDAGGRVSAFSASGGSRAWRTSLAPENEEGSEGYGGGLAADGGMVFVSTGFGSVASIDAGSGRIVWQKDLGLPIRSAPTTAVGKVFINTVEGKFYALSAADGTELWTFDGIGATTRLLTGASPAASGDMVFVPYSSGEVVALKADSGELYWSESLSTARLGSALESLTATASPVVDRGAVFAVSNSGRMVATSQRDGERLWSKNVSSRERPWVAGDVVYVVDTSGRLMSLSRASGDVRWLTKLPGEGLWSGPVLAGGKLWLASSKGELVGVDAKLGTVVTKSSIGEPVFIAPVVAGGRMYVLADNARLVALN